VISEDAELGHGTHIVTNTMSDQQKPSVHNALPVVMFGTFSENDTRVLLEHSPLSVTANVRLFERSDVPRMGTDGVVSMACYCS
jgi:hypothetical protein